MTRRWSRLSEHNHVCFPNAQTAETAGYRAARPARSALGDNTLNAEEQQKFIVEGTWFGHAKGQTNRGALAVTLRAEDDRISGEFAFDDLVLGRTVALVRGRLRENRMEAELSEFRGAPNQLVPTKGELTAIVRAEGKEIVGNWNTDAGTSGSFFLTRDDCAMRGSPRVNQPQTWKTEIQNSPISSFVMVSKDLKELGKLFRTAAQQARERHEAWLKEYWHGQPPQAALAAIPLPTVEIVEGEAFTITTDLASLDTLEVKSNLKAISFYSYKQGAPIVPSHGLQLVITGINGTAAPLAASGVINVHGLEGNWVTGVLQKFRSCFAERARHRGWLHTAVADQLLTLLAVVPLTLLALYRLLLLLPDRLTSSSVLMVGLAIYLFLCVWVIFQQFLQACATRVPDVRNSVRSPCPISKRPGDCLVCPGCAVFGNRREFHLRLACGHSPSLSN